MPQACTAVDYRADSFSETRFHRHQTFEIYPQADTRHRCAIMPMTLSITSGRSPQKVFKNKVGGRTFILLPCDSSHGLAGYRRRRSKSRKRPRTVGYPPHSIRRVFARKCPKTPNVWADGGTAPFVLRRSFDYISGALGVHSSGIPRRQLQ